MCMVGLGLGLGVRSGVLSGVRSTCSNAKIKLAPSNVSKLAAHNVVDKRLNAHMNGETWALVDSVPVLLVPETEY